MLHTMSGWVILVWTVSAATVVAADEHPLSVEERAGMNRRFDEDIVRLTRLINEDPTNVMLYSRRGDARLFRAKFREAVADYEKMIELDATQEIPHWRLGIAYYFVGAYQKAARQFELYHQHDDVDRENGIWKMFCQTQVDGADTAQQQMLRYTRFDREPFPALYELYEGKTSAKAILEAIDSAEISEPQRQQRRFYAHLYIGFHHKLYGRQRLAIGHLGRAVGNPWARTASAAGPTYMWQVARLEYERLRAKREKPVSENP